MFSKRKKEKLYPIIFILTILCAVGYKVFFSGRLNKTSDDVIISTSETKESIESEETEKGYMDKLKPKRTVTIRYERLEYVSEYMIVDEEESDAIYDKLKEEQKKYKIRNLRRI